MKANIVHTDLNPCGGAEQVALGTIQALVEMDFDVELTLARAPNIARLKNAFGTERVGRLFDQIKRINSLGRLPIGADAATMPAPADDSSTGYDITINTHGDMLPYFLPSFSANNAITYCHYPIAINVIDSRDASYFAYLVNSGLIDKERVADTESRGRMWRDLRRHYLLMLENSLVITNSNFSKQAILTTLASENQAGSPEPMIISPPVNVEEFRPALYSAERSDHILVTSRVHPSKMLENAIHLASILKQKKIGKGMIIAGNLMEDDPASVKYYKSIVDMIRKFGVSDYVTLETNVPLTGLKSLMSKCKVYFHPLPEEPFGISIIEAMSAGLIAVVPDTGGHTEVVSKKYQFHSLIEAPGIMSSALNATQEERVRVSNSVAGFSLSQYLKDFQRVIRETQAIANV
ncbi:MAG: glycosyltransferase [Nitrososphaera sp.]